MDDHSTISTCLDLPVNLSQVENLWCPNDYERSVLKEYIDFIFNDQTSVIPTALPLPMMTDKKCLDRINPLLIILLIGILLLVAMNLVMVSIITHAIYRTKTDQRQNHSLQYDKIILKDNDIQPDRHERFHVKRNQNKKNPGRSTRT
ncbi:unnamed protein product [Rotaria sp. Silwood2]|nr:unnamed protein product [Rotaria sp. Silwood2]CAF3008392.1 unnamed protein product [Rotaria sp. Silwood2]CAF3311403.1 unnamed protein product [Rotaria sp. Silwood2]CAF3317920.1 unnamed protein product [Rotaria sp. Silwood2]CAF3931516.1 unnamed protein product [Rotaria sp. Silwood2]